MGRPASNLSGQQFGRLSVLSRLENRGTHAYWLSRCDCGATVTARGSHLKAGIIRSCGCLIRDTSRNTCKEHSPRLRHGNAFSGRVSAEYRAWQQMKRRCFETESRNFKNWGGRGITVCERWLRFENFLEDMGRRPHPDLSLDRINNDGNYEPGNCRWATRVEQMNNTRRSKKENK